MKEKLFILIIIFCFLSVLHLLYSAYVSSNILKDIKDRARHFIYHNSFYSYENGEFKFNDFENVFNYEIDCKIIFCIPLIGWNKGIIFYKDVFTSYEDGKIISASYPRWWYGRPNKIHIERKGLKWEIINIIDNPY